MQRKGLAATRIHAEKVCYTPSHVSGSDFLSCFFVYQHFCLPKTALSLAPWPIVNVT